MSSYYVPPQQPPEQVSSLLQAILQAFASGHQGSPFGVMGAGDRFPVSGGQPYGEAPPQVPPDGSYQVGGPQAVGEGRAVPTWEDPAFAKPKTVASPRKAAPTPHTKLGGYAPPARRGAGDFAHHPAVGLHPGNRHAINAGRHFAPHYTNVAAVIRALMSGALHPRPY